MNQDLITEVWLKEGDQAIKATAEVTFQTDFGELTLSHIKIIHQDGKAPWVAFPDIRYKDAESDNFKSIKVIIPGARLKKMLTDAILAKYVEANVESI